jgi:glycerol-3-phosphate O-acyltransferase
LKLGLVERPEATSKILFGDALKYYVEKGAVQKKAGDEKGKDKEQEYYSDTGDRYLIQYYSKQISHFMRSPRFTLH